MSDWKPEVGQDCEYAGGGFARPIDQWMDGDILEVLKEFDGLLAVYNRRVKVVRTINPRFVRPIQTEADKQKWPDMPDRFYEGLGWMHAECCAALDRGDDPRGFEVGEMVEKCIKDLAGPVNPAQTEVDKQRGEQIKKLARRLGDSLNLEARDCLYKAEKLYGAGCRTIAPDEYVVKALTDEQIEDLTFMMPTKSTEDFINAVQRELGIDV